MQILGKIQIEGEQKEVLLKEENEFFKYYSLELIGAYIPKMKDERIIFKKSNILSEQTKMEVVKLVNSKVNEKMIQQNNLFQILGQVSINEELKEILVQKEDEFLKYYYLKLIGVYTPKIPGETIIFRQDTLENKLSAEIKDNEQKNKISPLEKEQMQQFLERIKILDIIEKIQTQERGVKQKMQYNKTRTNEINERQDEIQRDMKQQEDLKRQQRGPEKVKNKLGDINIKQEVDMDTRVTDMSNLKQVLQKSKKIPKLEHGDEPLKMGIVESDDLKKLKNEKGQKEQGHSSRFEAVMITKKGKVQALDLDNDTQEGNNPLEKNYQIKQNDSIKQGDVLTRLKVGKGTIGIEKGHLGEVEVYHSPKKTIGGKGVEGNKSLDRQLETSNAKNTARGTNIETLKLAQEYNDGYRSVEEGYQEIETHKEQYSKCKTKSEKDLDGNPNTKSHTHKAEEFVELSSGEKVTYSKLASRWGFYKDGKPDAEYVKEKIQKKQLENKKTDDIINELDEEYEDPRQPSARDGRN